jgi:hypothetical protein
MTKVSSFKACQEVFCHYNSFMRKKIGRPTIAPSGPMGKVLQIRLTAAERQEYEWAATRAKMKLSAWIRQQLARGVRAAKKTERGGIEPNRETGT